MLDESEGWFYRSDNILREPDPAKIAWTLLPDGEHGLRNPEFGSIQSEQNVVPMNDGSLYCMYRTTTGYPCHAYSRDGGHTWSRPEFATYTPGGRRMKTPRACPRIWKTKNGDYLFWFHNHSGKEFFGRNPAWISGGVERDGFIHWSQPEILLYDPITGPVNEDSWDAVRISYPDLIEQDGKYWITETQKSIARVHAIDATLLEDLWRPGIETRVAEENRLLDLAPDQAQHNVTMPALPDLRYGAGITFDLRLALDDPTPGQVLFDARRADGKGVAILTTEGNSVGIELSDGATKAAWRCDMGLLTPQSSHHVVIVVDSGPKIITFIVDGVLCDGGGERRYGWGRFPYELGDINGRDTCTVVPSVKRLRLYNRPLRTAEAQRQFRNTAA